MTGVEPLTVGQGMGLVIGYALTLLLAAILLPITLACLVVERLMRDRDVDLR